jgi:hypothetical protein
LSCCLLHPFSSRQIKSHFIVSDRDVVLSQLHHTFHINVHSNLSTSSYTVLAIDWMSPIKPTLPPIDILIASDVLWLESLVEPFVETLLHYTTEQADILVAHQTRTHRIDQLFHSLIRPQFSTHVVIVFSLLSSHIDF